MNVQLDGGNRAAQGSRCSLASAIRKRLNGTRKYAHERQLIIKSAFGGRFERSV